VCNRWKWGRSTLHTSVNIMTNFNVGIIMNNVLIIINKHSFLYRFNDICLSVKHNVCWGWLLYWYSLISCSSASQSFSMITNNQCS
jgi:hypothetical protein